jgi:hypothetical protein
MASRSSTAADRRWRRIPMELTGIVERRGGERLDWCMLMAITVLRRRARTVAGYFRAWRGHHRRDRHRAWSLARTDDHE